MTVTVVFCRESNILCNAFGEAAFEWFGMFSLVLTIAGQPVRTFVDIDLKSIRESGTYI